MHTKRFLTIFLMSSAFLLLAAGNPPPTLASPEVQAELSNAFFKRLQSHPPPNSLTLDLFTPELDTAFVSPDGKTAVLWLALRDDRGRRLATEPGLALARLTGVGWQVSLPGDADWDDILTRLPDGMLPLEQSPAPPGYDLDTNAITAPLLGYYLPYAAGTSHFLEGSISHFQSIPELGYPSCSQEYCRYAYDFTDDLHYPLLASKSGTVVGSRDSCSDGNSGCTNYIVLHNGAEGTYQIYLHLSQNTIPNKLAPGSAVLRGQYLGDTDDTGYSTSNHVHFMVTNSIWLGGDGYYWGRSIDIRFADVAINNGIPRNCYEVTHFTIYDGATDCIGNKSDPRNPANDWFPSGNVGSFPPTGSLVRPSSGEVVAVGNTLMLDVTANASDDVAIKAVRMVAKLNGQWTEIGPKVSTPLSTGVYDWDVNLCAAGPINGPLEVGLRIWDYEGNIANLLDPHTIQVDHACPPPTSQLKPAETFNSTAVRLSWDALSSGAGIGSFELQWRTEPGVWDAGNVLIFPGEWRSTWFSGQAGGSYAFRLRALDKNNQPEPFPASDAFETSASLPASCNQDSFEPDDNPGQASLLSLDVQALRNLCGSGNSDWFRVDILEVGRYFIAVPSLNGGAAVKITLYAQDGTTQLAQSQASGLGQVAALVFNSFTPGRYYARIEPLVPNLMGTDAVYGITFSKAKELVLPLVTR